MCNFKIKPIGFNHAEISNIKDDSITDYPVVYLLNNDKEIYIGETVRFKLRMKDHLKNESKKNFKKTTVVYSEEFNQSATYNLETNIINYVLADGKYIVKNVSKTASKQTHNYYNKSYYHNDVFEKVWQELIKMKLVDNDLSVIKDRDIFKISPFKELSNEQYDLRNEIIQYCEKNCKSDEKFVFLVSGDAGTGKSVLLSSLFYALQELTYEKTSNLYKTNNFLLINHEEMMKTYKEIVRLLPNLKVSQIEKPTTFINDLHKKESQADIVVIDEAHLLLTQKETYNSFHQENHLQEIIKLSKIVIIIFDERQSLRIKGMWDEKLLEEQMTLTGAKFKKMKLTQQYRMKADEYTQEWINSFVDKKILKIPKDSNYDLRVFEDISEMYKSIKSLNDLHGLSRLVSTFDYEHKKDNKVYNVEIGDFKLPWNSTSKTGLCWAQREETINEVGSTYTIQGFDLNYVGVIIGPAIDYDEKLDELIINPKLWKDSGAFKYASNFDDGEKRKERLILNALNVLMKRGVSGLYIYAVNEKLRNRLIELSK